MAVTIRIATLAHNLEKFKAIPTGIGYQKYAWQMLGSQAQSCPRLDQSGTQSEVCQVGRMKCRHSAALAWPAGI